MKRKNPPDITGRNERHLEREIAALKKRVTRLEAIMTKVRRTQ